MVRYAALKIPPELFSSVRYRLDRASRENSVVKMGVSPLTEPWSVQPANNPMYMSNSKHTDPCHNFLREVVSRGEIIIILVKSDIQHAGVPSKHM